MTLKNNVFGDVYDDSEPAFIEHPTDPIIYNRIRRYWVTRESFDAQIAEEGLELGEGEIGPASDEWLQANFPDLAEGGGEGGGGDDDDVDPVIDSPADGTETDDPLYVISGSGAAPDEEVQLWSSNRDPDTDNPNATTTADENGAFVFDGSHNAAEGPTTWTVISDGVQSPAVTVTYTPAEEVPAGEEALVPEGTEDPAGEDTVTG